MNPSKLLYTPYYCEENVWQLCRQPVFVPETTKVVFISNPMRQCFFWYQRAATIPDRPLAWDYHVVLLTLNDIAQIYDLDTTLPFPCAARAYLQSTFMHVGRVEPTFDPMFRLVDLKDFVDSFSSDRSHMLDAHGNWTQPPPEWEPIYNGEESNLQRFIDMNDTAYGDVMKFNELLDLVSKTHS